MDIATKENINHWLNGNFDLLTKQKIEKLIEENPSEAIDAFYKELSFGTGGLRGIMGIGSNRMNEYTVRAATQGLANTLCQEFPHHPSPSLVIGYDTRHNSFLFAKESAKVLAGNGFSVFLFPNLSPTPLVSFACRLHHCLAAIMITASHNPPEYNGYKVYWNDGAQILSPYDQKITAEIHKIKDPSQVKMAPLDHPSIQFLDETTEQTYLQEMVDQQLLKKQNQSLGNQLKVVYTPLHGTGIALLPKLFHLSGFTNFHLVEKQSYPDGNFSTVKSPNPEDKEALEMGISQLLKQNADLLIATDPDADRLGAAINHQGKPFILNGNQLAVLLLDHILKQFQKKGTLPKKALFIKTIATTELFKAIVEKAGHSCLEVLTGFKYIAQKIRETELCSQKELYPFIFGAEESYGYLFRDKVRDKDGISSANLLAEAALEAKLKGKTLVDHLFQIYESHGFYYEKQLSLPFPETKEGRDQMSQKIHQLKTHPLFSIADIPVIQVDDYSQSLSKNLVTKKSTSLSFDKTEMFVFWMEEGSKIIIRPSGTEPKIKIYCGIKETTFDSISSATEKGELKISSFMSALKLFFKGS